MILEVYADVICPWCYVGERRLERALAMRPGVEVERRWRPFQLHPGMPEGGTPWDVFARRKFGGEPNARGAFARLAAVGEGERRSASTSTGSPVLPTPSTRTV